MDNGHANKVVLISGEVTDTWSDAWRRECLHRNEQVQRVLGMVGKALRGRRDAYCTSVGLIEGPEAEKRLREEVKRRWPKGLD